MFNINNMNVQEIKEAVINGEKVCWCNDAYEVIQDNLERFLIKCNINGSCIGLTHTDNVTLNGHEDEFYKK